MGGFIGVLRRGPFAFDVVGGRLPGFPPSRGSVKNVRRGDFAVDLYQRGEEASSYVGSRWVVGLYGYLGGWKPRVETGARNPSRPPNAAEGLLEEFLARGPAAFARARGQWSAFLFDCVNSELFLARDVPGSRPLYACRSGSAFCFATEPIAAARSVGLELEPDVDVLGGYVRTDPPEDRTVFKGVNRIRPGTFQRIEVRREDTSVFEARYWRNDGPSPVPPASFEDTASELRERLHVAVDRSLPRGRVAATLSGGLDSSSVLALAAEIRGKACAEKPLALSLRFPSSHTCDEGPYIAAACRHTGISQLDIEVRGTLQLEHLLRVYSMVEAPVFINSSFFAEIADAARRAGATVVLTGHGGDHLLDGDPGCLDDMVRAGRIAEAGELGRDLWLEGTCSALLVAKEIGGRRAWRWLSRLGRPGPLQHSAPRTEGRAVERERTGVLRALEVERRMSYFDGCVQMGEALEVEFRDPLFDLDIIEFVLSLRPGLLMNGGKYKALLREAMRGLLPDAILKRTSKTDFTEVSRPIWEEWFIRESHGCLDRMVAAGVVTNADRRKALCGDRADVNRLRRELASVGAFWQTYFEADRLDAPGWSEGRHLPMGSSAGTRGDPRRSETVAPPSLASAPRSAAEPE
jgi:asparagine synthase (glutamine-hydrolysing)